MVVYLLQELNFFSQKRNDLIKSTDKTDSLQKGRGKDPAEENSQGERDTVSYKKGSSHSFCQ